jgi:cyclophilin family peptidyl-prolyl cis-trans isomerase
MRTIFLKFSLAAVAVSLAAFAANPKVPEGSHSSGGLHATIETSKGVMEIEFYPMESPRAVENFRLLAEHHYYDNTIFHRVIRDFMIQGGDPLGDGTGGESAWGGFFPDEINRSSPVYQRGYRRGIVAMANSGPNTNASQFFIMHGDFRLPPSYVIIGHVTKGLDVLDALATTPTRMSPMGEMSIPLTPLVVKKITISP